MIDTHCHLDYLSDPQQALLEDHLSAVIAIGADVTHAQNAIALAEQHPAVWAVVGLHPTDVSADSPQTRVELERLAQHPKVVGIGETGLDYYWDKDPKMVQMAAFEWQLDWARRVDKPVIIHTRDKQNQHHASQDCAEILKNAGWHKGILHCCNGHLGLIETALELGFHVSFAGNVTYKNAKDIQNAAQTVPLERILLETDAPFLSPMPHRGKPNRPAYTRFTLQFLSTLRGIPEAELEHITTMNACAVYGIPAID